MSITLNNSDFQCLQDQLVELKTKNYELTEKIRRSQADFEAAKAKICTLQLKLEEQERDFQTVSTTLRREIEAVSSSTSAETDKEIKVNESYKGKFKKLVHKAKELQQAYEKSVETVQQMNSQNERLKEKAAKLEEENINLKDELDSERKQLVSLKSEYDNKLTCAIEDHKSQSSELFNQSPNVEELKLEIERLSSELRVSNSLNESQAEELKILERKGIQTVRELKRQLALEKNRTEVLQGRLENILKEPQSTTPTNLELEIHSKLSTSSSTNGNNSNTSLDNGSRNNQDSNSNGSWSFVPVKEKSPNQVRFDSVSRCSTDFEGKENVQTLCDNRSEDSFVQSPVSKDGLSKQNSSQLSTETTSPFTQDNSSPLVQNENFSKSPNIYSRSPNNEGMLIEEQAALVERLTKMQHEKWMLEEKLSYLEQANSSLSEDLANKSDIIKHYFIDQALRFGSHNSDSKSSFASSNCSSRRQSGSSNLISMADKSSLKKVVDFLKERSQISLLESENISREATKKMQLMLEETLTKCLKLQENLDFVTSELNKLKG